MEPTLFEQGVNLMIIGMGTVFVFLSLLVVAVRAMSALVQRFAPAPPAAAGAASTSARNDEAAVVAAISAALTQHRRRAASQRDGRR